MAIIKTQFFKYYFVWVAIWRDARNSIAACSLKVNWLARNRKSYSTRLQRNTQLVGRNALRRMFTFNLDRPDKNRSKVWSIQKAICWDGSFYMRRNILRPTISGYLDNTVSLPVFFIINILKILEQNSFKSKCFAFL